MRHFFLRDGAELRERLLSLSDLEQTFSYCLLDTPVPLFNYVAHVRFAPVTDGNRTFWDWRWSSTTRAGEEADMTRMVGEDIYDAGFAAIRRPSPLRPDLEAAQTSRSKLFRGWPRPLGVLSSERGARFLGGGTFFIRAVNEADPRVADHRALDRSRFLPTSPPRRAASSWSLA